MQDALDEGGALPRQIAVLALTRGGAVLAGRLAGCLPGLRLYVPARWQALAGGTAAPLDGKLGELVARLWPAVDGLVICAAVGVVVRTVAPLLRDKAIDPAVVAVDEAGRYAVSVLSGHQGGANALARQVATALGAEPVITTATEALGLPAIDLLGPRHGWRLEAPSALTAVTAALVNDDGVGWFQDAEVREPPAAPPPFVSFPSAAALVAAACPAVVVSDRALDAERAAAAGRWVVYRPASLVLGVGLSSDATGDEIETLAREALAAAGLAWASLAGVATLDRKLAEPGLRDFATRHTLQAQGYPSAALAAVPVPHPSATVAGFVGTPSVCEAAALLATGGALVVPKQKGPRVTVAVARRATP